MTCRDAASHRAEMNRPPLFPTAILSGPLIAAHFLEKDPLKLARRS